MKVRYAGHVDRPTNVRSLKSDIKQEAQLYLVWGRPYWLSLTLNIIQGRWFAENLKVNKRLSVSD